MFDFLTRNLRISILIKLCPQKVRWHDGKSTNNLVNDSHLSYKICLIELKRKQITWQDTWASTDGFFNYRQFYLLLHNHICLMIPFFAIKSARNHENFLWQQFFYDFTWSKWKVVKWISFSFSGISFIFRVACEEQES